MEGKYVSVVNSLKRGNTALLEALMGMVHQFASNTKSKGGSVIHYSDMGLSPLEEAFDVLLDAGMAKQYKNGGYKLLWEKLKKRKADQGL